MKRNQFPYHPDRKWLMPTVTIIILSVLLLFTVLLGRSKSSSGSDSSFEQLHFDREILGAGNGELGLPKLPRFAYLITGTKGDGPRIKRVLQAAYHPRNYYLLHLDLEASDAERLELAKYVKSESVLRQFRNVMVVGKADLVTYKGPTMIACTLHGIAVLLKRAKDWDWFINLSASDYPIMSQDGKFAIFRLFTFFLLFIDLQILKMR